MKFQFSLPHIRTRAYTQPIKKAARVSSPFSVNNNRAPTRPQLTARAAPADFTPNNVYTYTQALARGYIVFAAI